MFETLKKMDQKERKDIIIIVVITVMVFTMGVIVGNLIESDTTETLPSPYAQEQCTGELPFELNGVKEKESLAIIEKPYLEGRIETYLEGNSEDLTFTLDESLCKIEYGMNEEGTGIDSYTTVDVYYFIEGEKVEHPNYRENDDGSVEFFGFPKDLEKIFMKSIQPLTAHTFFTSSEYEYAKRYEKIKEIEINFV